jgi:2,3-bisphosphoglycerate-independent phosphoglycerate mutase
MEQPKVALLILDGFGITSETNGNAVLSAPTPFFDDLFKSYPKALLKASSEEVGLPWGEFGNSEVGHTTIGLGRVIIQDLPQIDKAIKSESIITKPAFAKLIEKIKAGAVCNFVCLASDGAVHGRIRHMEGLVALINKQIPDAKIRLHLISDGRDVAEKSIENYLKEIRERLPKAEIASLMGRYFAMDRDKNWDRIQVAYDAIVGNGRRANSVEEVVESSYAQNITDEFIEPVMLSDAKINLEKDVVILTNFRSDRAMQITRAFIDPSLSDVKREALCSNFIAMTTYDDNLPMEVFFSNLDLNNPEVNSVENPLSKIISEGNMKQFHVAESEKFAHVTYFMAGGIREDFAGQENKFFDSAKVPSYDRFPQMRAYEISSEIINASSKGYNFIVANFANGDMVGHAGNFAAAQKAVTILDDSVSKCFNTLIQDGYDVFITSDHGNCDEMINLKSGKPNKEHSLSPVPFVYSNSQNKSSYSDIFSLADSEPIGILADIAPTITDSLGLTNSPEMTGVNLKDSLT